MKRILLSIIMGTVSSFNDDEIKILKSQLKDVSDWGKQAF